MDIRLGGGRDGIDAALALLRDLDIRCIFATAHGDDDTIRRARDARPLGWLTKSYSIEALVKAINDAIRKKD
jgi:DNA-binding NarL/FixJ family response regulator